MCKTRLKETAVKSRREHLLNLNISLIRIAWFATLSARFNSRIRYSLEIILLFYNNI